MEALFSMENKPTNFPAEYVWIDACNNLRSKYRTIWDGCPELSMDSEFYPIWNFDGSSTGQSLGNDSEIIIIPRAVFNDPFQLTDESRLVFCDCYEYSKEIKELSDPFANMDTRLSQVIPIKTNSRKPAQRIFDLVKSQKPWFGLEQEYVLYNYPPIDIFGEVRKPLGWASCIQEKLNCIVRKTDIDEMYVPDDYKMDPQGKYYCGVGIDRAFGRKIAEEHYTRCLSAGIKISGINGEVMPSQWEFQIGPCEGIEAGDHLWMARFILQKVCEFNGVRLCLNPKPEKNWNGSGCHINFSDKKMRSDNGIEYIYKAIKKLENTHSEHLKVYGNNEHRLIGTHETSNKDKFTWGVSDRTASVRIPLLVYLEKKGYLEDRRPASDVDPYIATAKLAETILF